MQDKIVWNERLFLVASRLTVIFPLLLLSNVAADIGICIIVLAFLAHCHLEKQWGWLKEGWARALLILWLYMIARGMFALHPKEALSRGLPFVRYIVFAAALARWTLAHEATRRRFFHTMSASVILFACDGLLQYAAGRDLLWHKLIHDPNNGHIRLAGPFSRPILGIMLAWLAFPALLPVICEGKGRFPAIVCAFAVLAAIALSGERMALMLTVFGLALAVLLMRPPVKIILAGLGGSLLLLGALTFLIPDMAGRQIHSTADTLQHWQESPYGMLLSSDMTLVKEDPIFGLGANHFRIHCEELYPGDAAKITAMCNTHPHNIYFEWLIEEGIIGLALFVAFVVPVLKNSLRACCQDARNPALAGFLIAFVLRVWPLMTTTGFFSRWGAPPFWLVLGALLVYTAGKGDKNAGASLPVQDTGL